MLRLSTPEPSLHSTGLGLGMVEDMLIETIAVGVQYLVGLVSIEVRCYSIVHHCVHRPQRVALAPAD